MGKPIVAIVDDERYMCSLLATLFKKNDIPVSFIAYDVNEALLKFECSDPKPDIVIMDHRIQYDESMDLMKEMLLIQPSTKIIFLSSEIDVMKEAYGSGAMLFLVKPVSIKTIIDAINIVHNNEGKYEYNGFTFVKSEV